MGCSPSALLEHIHRDPRRSQQAKAAKSKIGLKIDSTYQNTARRKSSLPCTPEEDFENNKQREGRYGFLSPPTRTPLTLLLVSYEKDEVFQTYEGVGQHLGFDVTMCDTQEEAVESYQRNLQDAVMIDCRNTGLDYMSLCRTLKHIKGSQHSPIFAVVSNSIFGNCDGISKMLEHGFNRCVIDNPNINYCTSELTQIKVCDIKSLAHRATNQALYAALEKSSNIICITDDSFKCQYVNNAAEKVVGFKQDDIMFRSLNDLVCNPVQLTAASSSLLRGKEWFGAITLKKPGVSDIGIFTTCKAVPVACTGRMPTHFVFVMELAMPDMTSVATPSQPRGSIHSLRRGSCERSISSDYLRRASIAKLTSFPLEAPITKIIGLIDQAREASHSSPHVVLLLEKVEDILRCSELYTPQVKHEFKSSPEEPVVSDLITALLNKQAAPASALSSVSRRSSNDSAIYKGTRTHNMLKLTPILKDLLDNSLHWDFEIFRLEEQTKKKPLQYIGMHLFAHFDVANILNCDEAILNNWLMIIEAHYHADNFYHNSTHAADVMQATAGFLEKDRIKGLMEPLDEALCLIAAAAHDVDHPGKSSAFLSNSDNPLAILYNDVTVLESHHAALMFKLTIGDPRVNIFKNLDRDTYKIARSVIIDMILATEMTKHFEHLAKFVNVFCGKAPHETDTDEELSLPENVTLVKRMMIKCADVSNPTRPLRLCVEWARRIAEEYFQQTDEEKLRSLPIVMPMFDRNSCSIPKSQIGFVDYIINDMMEAWNAFIDMPELIKYMRQNYIRWKEFDEQGQTTLADLKVLQMTLFSGPSSKTKE